jgi:REP element-mobilizing transposase RayT
MKRYPNTSNRLKTHDYTSSGNYFVTICLRTRSNLFGDVRNDGALIQSSIGNMIATTLMSIPDVFRETEVIDFVVMPDHLHTIIGIDNDGHNPVQPSLGQVIGWFKGITRHRYSTGVKSHGWPRYETTLWLHGFHDHIIRNDADFANCMNYIEQNPVRWAQKRNKRGDEL